jgi:GNAT superfamily N-acetyltransferase
MLNIRKYKATDFSFIHKLIVSGARTGHFSESVQYQAADMIREYILKGKIKFGMMRNGKKEVYSREVEILLAEVNEQPSSFLMTAIDPNGDVELHLAATADSFSGHGYFSALIDFTIQKYAAAPNIYARCYNESIKAKEIFERKGFEPSRTSESITTYTFLRRDSES